MQAVVHHSPGLAALFAGTRGERPKRILDLGPAIRANLEAYGRFAACVRVVDLLRDVAGGEGANLPLTRPTAEQLAAALPAGEPPYDIVLLWDLLDYLDAEGWHPILARLAECGTAGSRLFLMVFTMPEMPARPTRFEIVDDEHLAYRVVTEETRRSPRLAPAEVERRLSPFRVERSTVLRHGVREYVAVLPRETEL
ncbi:MAG: hypothetical protein ACM3O7_05325 [Acidobacteriota bacterium]